MQIRIKMGNGSLIDFHLNRHLTEELLHVTGFNVQSKNSIRIGAVQMMKGCIVVAGSDAVLRELKSI